MIVKNVKNTNSKDYRNINSLFDSFFGQDFLGGRQESKRKPAVNISESTEAYHLDFAVPGLTKSDFKIEVVEDSLVVSCDAEIKEEPRKIRRQEFSYNTFHRSFILPENINEENIKARYENGVLKIDLVKSPAREPKKKLIDIA